MKFKLLSSLRSLPISARFSHRGGVILFPLNADDEGCAVTLTTAHHYSGNITNKAIGKWEFYISMKYKFIVTTTGLSCNGRVWIQTPVNVCRDGVACTINTRYEAMALPLDILSLAHYPKTVILVEHYV